MKRSKSNTVGQYVEQTIASAMDPRSRHAAMGEMATRQRVMMVAFGMLLPNPDLIMRQMNVVNVNYIYRSIRTDPHVRGCIKSRKAAVLRKEWGIDRGKAPSRVSKEITAMFGDLDIHAITASMLDACQYGWQPMEIMWTQNLGGSLWYPERIEAKPAAWFGFGLQDNLLYLKTMKHPRGELPTPRKFLCPTQEASYNEPYGVGDLSSCFWPVTFKKSGLGWWASFIERFGQLFPIGKHPRSAGDLEKDMLLEACTQLLQDGAGVIPDDESISFLESSQKSATATLFKEFRSECIDEINVVQLGHTGSARSVAGKLGSEDDSMQVREDITFSDEQIAERAYNELIDHICYYNFRDCEPPRFSFYENRAVDTALSERDMNLVKVGVRFNADYVATAYNLNPEDFTMGPPQQGGGTGPEQPPGSLQFAEAAPGADPVKEIKDLMVPQLQKDGGIDQIMAVINGLLENGTSIEDFRDKLLAAWPDMDKGDLQDLMAQAMQIAAAKGVVDVSNDKS